ncbi:hypothetical protein ACQRIU_003912 [Beauveria bassiana]
MTIVRTSYYRRQIPPAPFAMPTIVVIAVITAVTVATAVAVDIIGDIIVDSVRGETVLTSTFIWLGLLRRLGRAARFTIITLARQWPTRVLCLPVILHSYLGAGYTW